MKFCFFYSRLEHAVRPRPFRPILCIHRPTIYARGRHPAPPPGTPHPARNGRGQPRHQSPAPHRPCRHPSRIATTCRGRGLAGLLPCLLTLCVNRAALARALTYKFLISYKLCLSAAAEPRPVVKGGPGPPVGALVASFAGPMAAPPSGMHRGVIGHHAGIVRCLRGTGDAAAHSTRHVRLQCRGNRRNAARCLRSWLGCGYTAPSPPAPPMRRRLAGVSKPRSRMWYASLTAPRNDSPPPFLRPLRRSLSARGFATCRPGSSCHLLRRVAHVRVCAAYSQWSSVSREHPPRRLARQTSPAAAVTSPRI